MSSSVANGRKSHKQLLFVMRHGQRWDDANRAWRHEEGARTWDPPLTELGVEQAMGVGEKLRSQGVQVSRILVSPFLRCVQTAAGFIQGMYPNGSDIPNLKVSIEYGLAELMNSRAIRYPPRDPENSKVWNLSLEELFSALPSGVVDVSVPPVLPQLPNWDESYEEGHHRYISTFRAIADMFPHENVLCISHGEGLAISVSNLSPKVSLEQVQRIQYCAYTQAEREVFSEALGSTFSTGSWKLLTASGFQFKDSAPKR